MPAPGSSTFGPYEIIGPLGSGGMGEVYRARDPRLQRNVALKILRETNGHDPLRQTRLLHEARAASALNHPNILVVYDVGTERDVPYVVSELIDGRSLRDVLSRGSLPIKELLDLAVQIADGLSAAHEAGLVHRDLKPENVMVTPDGRVKILDFGIAKIMSPGVGHGHTSRETVAQQSETASGLVQGTVPYMSPEQARGGGVDFRSDQFSFGLLLYEMATGTRAFSRDTPVQTLTAIIEDEPRPLAEANPKTPLLFRWIVDRCLAKDPRQRYAATADLAHDLRTLRDRLKETSTNSGAIEAVVPPRRRWLFVVAAIVGALAVAILAAALVPPSSQTAPRFTPLASDSGYQGMPAWSPDGKTIAYVAEVNGLRQIFTQGIASSLRAQITHARFDCRDPFWGRDGSRIYYVSAAKEGYGVFSVSAAGGSADLVMLNADSAVLSPDGRTLAFLRSDERDTNLQVWLSSPPGAEPKRYTQPPFGDQRFSDAFMRYTPDGSRLTIWGRTWPGPSATSLWIFPTGAAAPYQVTSTPPDLSTNLPPRFDWLLDSRRAVAALERISVQGVHLWVLDTDTGQTVPLTTGAGTENTPVVSPDGRRIAYASQDINFDLIEVPLDGSPPRPLLATSRNEMEPGWSPTSPEYAFVTDRTGRYEIWLRSLDGAWERPLVTGDNFADRPTLTFRGPTFSPDGQKIVFERVTSEGPAIWVATRAAGSPVPVIRGTQGKPLAAYSPTWSPDGEWIAFLNVTPGHWSLEKVRAGTPSAPMALHEVTGIDHPQWSPDNRWIASNTAQGLSLIAAEGNATKVLDEETWIVYGWARDGSSLYGVKQSDDSQHLVLMSVDVASGRMRVLNEALAPVPPVNAPIKGFSRISDKSFATSLVRVRSDLWLMDDFLPQLSLLDRFWPRNLPTAWRTQNNPRSP